MATSGELEAALSDLLSMPASTVNLYGRHLRSASFLSMKGHGRGAAEMTARDAAIWLVALLIDHERGGDFVREVKRVLGLPLVGGKPYSCYPDYFADGLMVKSARNAAEAVESLFYDVLRDRLRRPLEEMGKDDTLTLSIDPTGSSVASHITGPYNPQPLSVAMFVYRRSTAEPERRNIERNVSIHGRVFLEIAKLLELEVPVHA